MWHCRCSGVFLHQGGGGARVDVPGRRLQLHGRLSWSAMCGQRVIVSVCVIGSCSLCELTGRAGCVCFDSCGCAHVDVVGMVEGVDGVDGVDDSGDMCGVGVVGVSDVVCVVCVVGEVVDVG